MTKALNCIVCHKGVPVGRAVLEFPAVAIVSVRLQSRGGHYLEHDVTSHVGVVDVDQGQSQTTSADGPGLLQISWQGGNEYQFTVACPDTIYSPPHQAEWSHATESYKQKWRPNSQGQAYPDSVTGGNGIGGTLSLTRSLCNVSRPHCPLPQPQSRRQ
jgi:hypothetical protein